MGSFIYGSRSACALSELNSRVAGLARVQAKWLIARSLATPATTTTLILSVDKALQGTQPDGNPLERQDAVDAPLEHEVHEIGGQQDGALHARVLDRLQFLVGHF